MNPSDIQRFRASTAHFTKRFEAKAKDTVGELYIYDSIGGGGFFGGISAQNVVDSLAQLKKDGAKSLNIYINSPGGDVFDGVAMYSAIKRFDGTKTVYVDGLAASAASLIAMAGDKIVMSVAAMVMIHSPWSGAVGNAADLRKVADTLDQVNDTLIETYAKRTGNDPKTLRKWLADETWMTAAEAKDKGFADEVLDDAEDAADGGADEATEKKKNAAAAAPKAEAPAHPLLDKFEKTPEALREAARAPSALLAEMKKRNDSRGRASPTAHKRPGQPERDSKKK